MHPLDAMAVLATMFLVVPLVMTVLVASLKENPSPAGMGLASGLAVIIVIFIGTNKQQQQQQARRGLKDLLLDLGRTMPRLSGDFKLAFAVSCDGSKKALNVLWNSIPSWQAWKSLFAAF